MGRRKSTGRGPTGACCVVGGRLRSDVLWVPGWPETLLRLGQWVLCRVSGCSVRLLRLGARVVLVLGLRGALSVKRFDGVGRKGLSRRWEVLQREFAAGWRLREEEGFGVVLWVATASCFGDLQKREQERLGFGEERARATGIGESESD
ncbi:hypothetical protein AAHE18_19G091300 [Arachis hypogaea]